MFKELKVIKLLVILVLLITLFYSIKPEKLAGLYIITDRPSYKKGDTVNLFFKTGTSINYEGFISVKNYISKEVVSKIAVDFKNQEIVEANIIENGFQTGYSIQFVLDEKYKPGIYDVEGLTSFVVSTEGKSDVTIVYPYISSLLAEPFKDKNALNGKVKVVSKSRSISMDSYTEKWIPFFQWLEENYTVNYIADLQLENLSDYEKSKCLFIYGNSSFWTNEMKKSFFSYNQAGSNTLVACTFLMNNGLWNDANRNQLSYSEKGDRVGFSSWIGLNSSSVIKELGMTYALGSMGVTTSKLEIINQDHMLFNNVREDVLEVSLAKFVGYPLSSKSNYNNSWKFYKASLLAATKYTDMDNRTQGILELKKDSLSGTIISLGTGEWAEQEAFESKGSLFQIAKNGIAYLVQL